MYIREKNLSSNDYLYSEISSKYDLKVQRIDQGINGENPRNLERHLREVRGNPEVLALCPSTPEPIPWGNSREHPHGNFRFPRSSHLYRSFRGAPPTRKFSNVPFTRRVHRVSLFRSRSLIPRTRVSSPAVSFSLSRRSTHACWNVEAFVRRSKHARKYTRANRGCISMYFYARVIAPTVYFYPTRVICNEPPSDRAERRGSRGLDTVSAVRCEEKRSGDCRCSSNVTRYSRSKALHSQHPRLDLSM